MQPTYLFLCVLLLGACALPSFDKVEMPVAVDAGKKGAADVDAGQGDGGSVVGGPACGRSNELAPKCGQCIQMNCCDEAQACGKGTDCGKDMVAKITPTAQFSAAFEPLLGCMQERCDEECGVSWGCADNYAIPAADNDYQVSVQVADFAAVPTHPLPDITTDACRSLDPGCDSGRAARGVTDKTGKVELKLPAAFDGFFEFSGGDYLSSTVQWSEPVYRNSGFAQGLLAAKDLQNFALATGVHADASDTFDPALGHIIFRVQNCLPISYIRRGAKPPHAEAANVQVMIDAADGSSPVFYTDRVGSVSPELEATSTTGLGGAFNFPGRNRSVTAFDAETGRQIAKATAVVRPQTIAFVYLVPPTAE